MGEVMRHFLEFVSVFSDFENYTHAKGSPTYGSHLDTFSTSLPSGCWSKNVSEPDEFNGHGLAVENSKCYLFSVILKTVSTVS